MKKSKTASGGIQGTLFSQGDFPANHTAQPENGLEKRMSAISGRRCLESFANSGHGTLWAKTWLESLVGTGAWFSRRCKLTWKLKGTKYKRLYFQLQVSTLPTEGIGFGLLPTVVTTDKTAAHSDEALAKRAKAGFTTLNLRDQATRGLLPTPTVMDTNCGDLDKIDKRRARAKETSSNGNGFGRTIGELANRGLLPTPDTQNHRDGTKLRKDNNMQEGGSHGVSLHHLASHVMLPTPIAGNARNGASSMENGRMKRKLDQGWTIDLQDLASTGLLGGSRTGNDSQLNPQFVAEMMGFPVDWLELPFLDTAGNPSKPTGMPLCRKSRCRYSGRSLRRKGG